MFKESLIEFFTRPGINKSGVCKEANITLQYLNRVLAGTQPVTEKLKSKLLPILKTYGYAELQEK